MPEVDTNRPLFVLEKDDRILLMLTTTDTFRPGLKTPLWHMEFDRDYPVQNAVVWVGERERLWPEWQRIAETRGTAALQSHLEEIWETQPIEHADTFLVTRHADNLGIDVQVIMTSHRADIISHRFDSEQECRVFDQWLTSEGAAERVWQLIELGCLDGRDELHRIIHILTDDVMNPFITGLWNNCSGRDAGDG